MALTRLRNNALDPNTDITADQLDIGPIGGRRNLIINGAMQVWQRGTSFTDYGGYTADRWFAGNPSTMSVTRVSTPYGYGLSYTRSASWGVYHRIEWQNVSWLKAGDTLTLQYICNRNAPHTTALQDGAGNGATYASTSTITDEGNGYFKIVETYVVTQALIDVCSAVGYLHLGLEPCSLTGEFTLTNVQLELGSVATPFEHRSYGEELALCQRYYYDHTNETVVRNLVPHQNLYAYTDTVLFPVTMRATPSISVSLPEYFDGAWRSAGTACYRISKNGFNWEPTGSFTPYVPRLGAFRFTADAEL